MEKIELINNQKKTKENEQEKEQIDLIPEERLREIIDILLPYGYSYHNGRYTGVSPYIGESTNVISIVANNPQVWGSVFSICMDNFNEEEDEDNSLGFYMGIMKVIAPELYSNDETFKGNMNVLDFNWADDREQDNSFPVVVKLKK